MTLQNPFAIQSDYMSYQSVNPANGESLQSFKETTDQELEAALQTASKTPATAVSFPGWASRSL
jgi:acyl-CoA reductase-like NAD-dependent aldehyde dehydrogenase